MPDTDILNKSVTRADYADNPASGVFLLSVASWPQSGALPPDLAGLTFGAMDKVLVTTLDEEPFWAGAVAIAVSKVASLAWEVNGDIPLRVRKSQDLLLNADAGRGWVSFISKTLTDYLTTNNGCFIEIVRDTPSEDAPIIGIIPLDSLRCRRTGDPDEPVQYQDLKGALHNLKFYEVIEFADLPSSRATLFGSGRSASYRAYKAIYKMASIDTYISDKVSGRRPLALHLVRGINDPQLRSVLDTANAAADARGAIAYMGAIMAAIPGDTDIPVSTIELASFPDNFNRKEEFDIGILAYANNLGLDPQDLQPLTGQPLGTGAQSQVLADKAKGKGLSSFKQQLIHALNKWVLPDLTTLEFVEKDWRDKKLQAEYNTAVESYVGDSVTKGIITADQGLQVMVDENIFDKAFLPEDITPDETLTDTEKPDAGADQPPTPPVPQRPAGPPAVPPVPVAAKEVLRVLREIQKESRNV